VPAEAAASRAPPARAAGPGRRTAAAHSSRPPRVPSRARAGAGLHAASSAFYDAATDGSRTVRWESKAMYALATVFALAV
jgi:hypothetical protein